jgi:hypothetical protein
MNRRERTNCLFAQSMLGGMDSLWRHRRAFEFEESDCRLCAFIDRGSERRQQASVGALFCEFIEPSFVLADAKEIRFRASSNTLVFFPCCLRCTHLEVIELGRVGRGIRYRWSTSTTSPERRYPFAFRTEASHSADDFSGVSKPVTTLPCIRWCS